MLSLCIGYSGAGGRDRETLPTPIFQIPWFVWTFSPSNPPQNSTIPFLFHL